MRLARALTAVAAGLSGGGFLNVALGADIGEGCGSNGDCNSICCTSEATTPVCALPDQVGFGQPCFTMDGCDCGFTNFSGQQLSCVEDGQGRICAQVCVSDADCGESGCCGTELPPGLCAPDANYRDPGESCFTASGCDCKEGLCIDGVCTVDNISGDPHMVGLRGQKIDWSGVDGGWYSLVKDSAVDLQINVLLTAPLPDEFPDRQLITGLGIMSEGHSLVLEVKDPYTIATEGCPRDVSPCLANGGLRAVVDGKDVDDLLRFSRKVPVAGGAILVSASNLPVECRQFGGDKIWARMYEEMVAGTRTLGVEEKLEDWILGSRIMAAPEWCVKYVAENSLADLQSIHAIFKIEAPTATVRLNAGVNHQGDGEMDWNGRVLPDLEFWQMDVGLYGLDIESITLSGILGETARPVYDDTGAEVMGGLEAIRGSVEDYRVSGPLGTSFALLDKLEGGIE